MFSVVLKIKILPLGEVRRKIDITNAMAFKVIVFLLNYQCSILIRPNLTIIVLFVSLLEITKLFFCHLLDATRNLEYC